MSYKAKTPGVPVLVLSDGGVKAAGYLCKSRFGGGKFVWLDWPQAEEHFSPGTIEYIETLDAQEDIDLLKTYGWDMPLPVARVFRISTMLLKKGAKKNLMPYDIGKIMCRSNSDEKSVIEEIVEKVEKESE